MKGKKIKIACFSFTHKNFIKQIVCNHPAATNRFLEFCVVYLGC